MKTIPQPFPAWKCLLTIAFAAVYGYIMIPLWLMTPAADIPDNDTATAVGNILLCLFPFLLGGLLYLLFVYSEKFRVKSFLKSLAVAFLWVVSAIALWASMVRAAYIIIEKPNIPISDYLFRYGFYTDKEPTVLFLFLSYLIAFSLIGWVVYTIAKRRYGKQKFSESIQI